MKKPIGRVRDVASHGEARGKVPVGQVLVYSIGDEMYRKVRVSTLVLFNDAELCKPYKKQGETVKDTLRAFSMRGFNGKDAYREAMEEHERRTAEKRRAESNARDQADSRMNGKVLLNLTSDDLKTELGIGQFGVRKNLLLHVEGLRVGGCPVEVREVSSATTPP